MKTLTELGISPEPWGLGSLIIGCDGLRARSSVDAYDGSIVAGDAIIKDADARLIAAAPLLYDGLREAVEGRCWECPYKASCVNERCSVHKWRAALAKAAGEEAAQ